MIWSSGGKSAYAIERSNSVVRMRVLWHDWKINGPTKNQAELQPSDSTKYSQKDGWMMVKNLHDGVLTIYIKLEGNELKLVWIRPLTGFSLTGQGSKGKFLFSSALGGGIFTLTETLGL